MIGQKSVVICTGRLSAEGLHEQGLKITFSKSRFKVQSLELKVSPDGDLIFINNSYNCIDRHFNYKLILKIWF